MQNKSISKATSGFAHCVFRGALAIFLCFGLPALAGPPSSLPPDRDGEVVPAGTVVVVKVSALIDFRHSQPGAKFAARLDEPLTAGDRVLVREGAPALLEIITSRSEAQIALVSWGNPPQEVSTQPLTARQLSHRASIRSDIGLGALSGAVLGGLVMGRIGVVTGAIGGLLTGEIVHAAHKNNGIPAETTIAFVLSRSVSVPQAPLTAAISSESTPDFKR